MHLTALYLVLSFSYPILHELCPFLLLLRLITRLCAFIPPVALLNDLVLLCLFPSVGLFYETALHPFRNLDNGLYIVLRRFLILLLLSVLNRSLTCNFLFPFLNILLVDSMSQSFKFVNFLSRCLYLLLIFPLNLFFLKSLLLILSSFVPDAQFLYQLKTLLFLCQYIKHFLHSFAAI